MEQFLHIGCDDQRFRTGNCGKRRAVDCHGDVSGEERIDDIECDRGDRNLGCGHSELCERSSRGNSAIHRDCDLQRRIDGQREFDGGVEQFRSIGCDDQCLRTCDGRGDRASDFVGDVSRKERVGNIDGGRCDCARCYTLVGASCGWRNSTIHGDGDIRERTEGRRDVMGDLVFGKYECSHG